MGVHLEGEDGPAPPNRLLHAEQHRELAALHVDVSEAERLVPPHLRNDRL